MRLVESLLLGHPIDLFTQPLFGKSRPTQDGLAMLDHLRMATQVSDRISRGKPPIVGVLADEIIDAPCLTKPGRVFPGTTDRRNVFEPRHGFDDPLQLFAIAEFRSMAGAMQQKELVLSGHPPGFRLVVKRPGVAHEWCDTSDSGNQQMIGSTAGRIEGEAALGRLAHEQLVAEAQFMQQWRQIAAGNEFEKELDFVLAGRRDDRVRALPALFGDVLKAKGGVLAGRESEVTVDLNAHGPQGWA